MESQPENNAMLTAGISWPDVAQTFHHVRYHFFNGAGRLLLETPLSIDRSAQEIDASTLAITASVRITRRLHWWLLGFGADVEVVGPVHLRAEIRQCLAMASSRYA